MFAQAWIAVTFATPTSNMRLTVMIGQDIIRSGLNPPGTNRIVRRCVSPGKHEIKVIVTSDIRSKYSPHSDLRALTVELPPESDQIILVSYTDCPAPDFKKPFISISVSPPAPRDPKVWPLLPENIWGYSKDRCTVVEAPAEEEEPIVRDAPRIIDNATDATVTRQIEVSKDWKRTVTIETEGSTKVGASVKAGEIGIGAEAALATKYGASTEETHTYTEGVSVTVPPHSKVTLSLAWKLRIRKGLLRYFDEAGFTLIDIPFSVVTGVTFDQITS